jgi:DNA polymerase-3 subunit epsilon
LQVFAVIDFETTGLSPAHGARPTEVAAVLVRDGKIHDRYQSLMNAGAFVPYMIEELTGISNAMVRAAPKVATVMHEVAEFVGDYPLVAHNAAFDSKFWDAEFQRIKLRRQQEFICSLLLARRIYPTAQSYKLSALAASLGLPGATRYHRALADAEVTAHLFLDIKSALQRRYQLPQISHELMFALQNIPRSKLGSYVEKYSTAVNRAVSTSPSIAIEAGT